jgi:hypothetical protein
MILIQGNKGLHYKIKARTNSNSGEEKKHGRPRVPLSLMLTRVKYDRLSCKCQGNTLPATPHL